MRPVPYAHYVDSGVQWLDKKPFSWKTARLNGLVCYVKSSVSPERLNGVRLVHYSIPNVQAYGIGVEEDGDDLDSSKLRVQQGDLLVSKLNPRKDTIAVVGCHSLPVVSSTEFVPLRAHGVDTRFLFYLFKSSSVRDFLCSMVESATKSHQRVDPSEIFKLAFPMPTAQEQADIANFLDRETAKIDYLIDKQEQLIKLLEEKRQAVISHAVTRGLDPDVRMTDSGVEWLGQVPEHWEVLRLKHLIAELESGTSVNAEDTPAGDGQVGVLKTSCVYTRAFRGDENKTVFADEIERVKCPVRARRIVISRMNTPDLVGAAAFVDRDYEGIYLPDRLWQTRFSDEERQDPRYLAHYMGIRGFRDQIAIFAEGASSSMQSIAKEDFLSIPVLVPPTEEQKMIAQNLEVRIGKLGEVRQNGQRQIELLRERRAALISAAVTGKIDVRSAN